MIGEDPLGWELYLIGPRFILRQIGGYPFLLLQLIQFHRDQRSFPSSLPALFPRLEVQPMPRFLQNTLAKLSPLLYNIEHTF